MNYVNEYCHFNDANKTLYFNNGLTVITEKMVPKSIRPDIENVVIPNTVQKIDNQVFAEYISLKTIDIPDSVHEIGESVFFNCVSLEKVSIGSGVKTIGDISFLRCPEIKRVEITDLSAWINIDFKTSFSIPLSQQADLYLDGKKITNLKIPKDVGFVLPYAFIRCKSIESVSVPGNISYIDHNAFAQCRNLKKVNIENGVKAIYDFVFESCTSLDMIKLPSSINQIGQAAFDCQSDNLKISCPATNFFKRWGKENDFDIYTSELGKFINSITPDTTEIFMDNE